VFQRRSYPFREKDESSKRRQNPFKERKGNVIFLGTKLELFGDKVNLSKRTLGFLSERKNEERARV